MSTQVRSVDLSIIVPAFNEEHRLPPTLARLHEYLAAQSTTGACPRAAAPPKGGAVGSSMSWEIIVVDDGSRDATCAVVERAMAQIPHLRLVRQTPNRGKGSAVRLGMLAAHGRICVMSDADGSMSPDQLPRLLAPILAGRAEIAIGSRYAEGACTDVEQPRYRVLWSRFANLLIQRSLVPGVRDTQCGFKAFTAEVARDLFGRGQIDGWAFDLEILALARHAGYAIAEVGIEWTDDRRSRVNPLKDLWKVIREAMTIRKNLRHGVYLRDERTLPAAA